MTETEAREIAAPDSWPWPMSEEAKAWLVEIQRRAAQIRADSQKQEPQFNRAEHERFMRGLG